MSLKIATFQSPTETTASRSKVLAPATDVPEGTQDGTWGERAWPALEKGLNTGERPGWGGGLSSLPTPPAAPSTSPLVPTPVPTRAVHHAACRPWRAGGFARHSWGSWEGPSEVAWVQSSPGQGTCLGGCSPQNT